MKITLICVGKLKEKYLKNAAAEYMKRLSRYCKVKIVEVADERAPDNLSEAEQQQLREKESQRILSRLGRGTVTVALDIKGIKLTSEKLAARIQKFMVTGKSDITFIIGGSIGLDKSVLKKADIVLSLSDMTFPHQLTRIIILEQIYRSFRIINNEPYHK